MNPKGLLENNLWFFDDCKQGVASNETKKIPISDYAILQALMSSVPNNMLLLNAIIYIEHVYKRDDDAMSS